MKKIIIILILVNSQIINAQKIMDNSIYQFTVEDVDGETFDFSCLEGQKIMIVNTASRCGLTYQYESLQSLYDNYKDEGLVVVGVPSRDFRQEYTEESSVAEFCSTTYGVDFPMFATAKVRGSKAHPFFKKLESESIINNYILSIYIFTHIA